MLFCRTLACALALGAHNAYTPHNITIAHTQRKSKGTMMEVAISAYIKMCDSVFYVRINRWLIRVILAEINILLNCTEWYIIIL